MTRRLKLKLGDALLVVDLQNDFLPGGSLAVPGADRVIPVINAYIAKFRCRKLPVYASRDWHPTDHCSFLSQGGPWPEHCVAGSSGAQFSAALQLPEGCRIVSKGVEAADNGYSVFAGTGLHADLKHAGVNRLFVCGIATDYCVLQTVLSALHLQYRVFLLEDAVRAVNLNPTDGENAVRTMLAHGAEPLNLDSIL
ncbi:isochorismatase family protein [Methylomonas sp. MgM2]